ncbi:MAG: flagellar basal body-associated FliL family protein [Burkholderiales bacterium]|nr:flagellar basal body-associated FliL family protein [Burkholderiales bacterium]
MSAAIAAPAAAAAEGGAVPVKRGKKKLLIIVAAVLAVALAAGGGAVWYLKKRAAAAQAAAVAAGEEDGSAAEAAHADAKAEHKGVPVYLPLDPFIVNLADKEVDRYAQIGITLELESPVFADQMKTYMPAVRNAILLILAHKTSRELLGRAGKEELAEEIMREAVRPMGIEIAVPEPVTPAPVLVAAAATASGVAASGASGEKPMQDEASPKPKKAKKAGATVRNPVQHVHFSSFIIQ